MSHIAREFHALGRIGFGLLCAVTLGLLAEGPVLADQVDCEKVRTGTEPIRFTFENTSTPPLNSQPERVVYGDVIRDSPEGIVLFSYAGAKKFKSVISGNLLPLSFEALGKPVQTITYDADISTLLLSPGSSFTVNSVETPVGGVSTMGHHSYSIADGGHFDIAGCSFPVLSVHHITHYQRDKIEWDATIDSLISADLKIALRRHQVVVYPHLAQPQVFDSVATDLSATADMTKAP